MIRKLLRKIFAGCLLVTSIITSASQKEICLWPDGAAGYL
jgi:hypothetical protein